MHIYYLSKKKHPNEAVNGSLFYRYKILLKKTLLNKTILPQTTVHKKKDTLLGALNTPFTLTRENITIGTMDILVIRPKIKLATSI